MVMSSLARPAVYPVILCGGAGTRLWPASRAATPKQFVPLLGPGSSFQDTVLRLRAPGVMDPVIIAGLAHAEAIARQLADIGASATILLEPEARDSAAAMAAAALWIAARDPDAVAVFVASDHFVADAAAFQAALLQAADAAAAGGIVTFGVTPTAPSSAYGYIRPGPAGDGPVLDVAAFVEKPGAEVAQDYIDRGYLWNSGNFVAAAATLIAELRTHAPAVLDAAARGIAESQADGDRVTLGPAFRLSPKISIDYAVMEKTDRARVLPVAFGWSDLGAWDVIHAHSERDADGNAATGQAVMIDTRNSLVRAGPGVTVATIGVTNLAIIAEGDAVLVCDLSQSQEVKTAVARIQARAHAGGAQPPAAPAPTLAQLTATLRTWLDTSALPLWWSIGADHVRGGFRDSIHLNGQPGSGPRRARVQARQAHVYATAGRMGWAGPWRTAMNHGLAWFDSNYRRPDGLYRTLVAEDGAVLDGSAKLYDQAFALLAMASAHAADPDHAAMRRQAEVTLAAIHAQLGHAQGGFREDHAQPFQSNPHMHLFEAALAWIEAGGGAVWEDLAQEIAGLATTRFIDAEGGFLREFFAADWTPAEGLAGRLVEPGHQFEWAWLLARRADATGDETLAHTARRLFERGERGVSGEGVTLDGMLDDLTVHQPGARLWPQTERIKATLRFDPARAPGATRALLRYLDVSTPGLWRDKLNANGSFVDEPAPGSSLYHIIGAIEALRPWGQESV
jgi:mannose-1-phosphate guanylyltransferase/mannose-6-phosphate isomerase